MTVKDRFMKKLTYVIVLAGVILIAATPISAQETGSWKVRGGVTNVDPKSDNHSIVNVDNAYSATFNATYMVSERFGVELLAAFPYTHDVNLNAGGGRAAEFKHLPPTLSAQYYLPLTERVRMYAGIGVNYTFVYDEKTTGDLAGSDLDLDDSVGVALQLGADIDINQKWFVNLDARYIDIEADATLDGVDIGTVEVDPWLFGINVGYRF